MSEDISTFLIIIGVVIIIVPIVNRIAFKFIERIFKND